MLDKYFDSEVILNNIEIKFKMSLKFNLNVLALNIWVMNNFVPNLAKILNLSDRIEIRKLPFPFIHFGFLQHISVLSVIFKENLK